jgi:hypothetical protein
MVKRYVDFYEGLYTALLKDVQYSHPTLGVELARDGVRLRNLVDKRGLPTFTVDLPAMGKHLDRCLAEGEYKLSGLPGSRRFSKRTPIPKLFRGLYLLIFDEDGTLKEDANVEAISLCANYFIAQRKLLSAVVRKLRSMKFAASVRLMISYRNRVRGGPRKRRREIFHYHFAAFQPSCGTCENVDSCPHSKTLLRKQRSDAVRCPRINPS